MSDAEQEESGGGLVDRLHTPSPNPIASAGENRVRVRFDLAQPARGRILAFDAAGRIRSGLPEESARGGLRSRSHAGS